ncbi:hypothetical protein niasHT_017207 [Heterodera trifolii]|uniref:Uncharacterized protein n=1 Tax=Heterodera trifolii TaxID=157864 RepID=A0ABD2LDB1_9BILA
MGRKVSPSPPAPICRWPIFLHTIFVALIVTTVLLHSGHALSYICEGDQVLIVQSFGNDTIRMHCQRLNLCGNKKLTCHYEPAQPSCDGKSNFVAHVTQRQLNAAVEHTCCEYVSALSSIEHEAPSPGGVPGHEGNDCFVYKLPDGGTDKQTRPLLDEQYEQFTVLNNVDHVPVQLDGDDQQHGQQQFGYRLRLFLLRNKSPPVLLVKRIHRAKEGFEVTICRPRCSNLEEAETVKREKGWGKTRANRLISERRKEEEEEEKAKLQKEKEQKREEETNKKKGKDRRERKKEEANVREIHIKIINENEEKGNNGTEKGGNEEKEEQTQGIKTGSNIEGEGKDKKDTMKKTKLPVGETQPEKEKAILEKIRSMANPEEIQPKKEKTKLQQEETQPKMAQAIPEELQPEKEKTVLEKLQLKKEKTILEKI